jgi:hypothetical protein
MYIYQLISDAGHSYIGQRKSPLKSEEDAYMGSSTYFKSHPEESLVKKPIIYCENTDILNLWESFLICADKLLFNKKRNVNGNFGGYYSLFDSTRPEIAAKISSSCLGRPSPNKGTHLSEEDKAKKSASMKKWFENNTISEERKQKISKANRGREHTEEEKHKMSERMKGENNPFFGKTHTEEENKKVSEANKGSKHPGAGIKIGTKLKGYVHSPEFGKKISKSKKGRPLSESHKAALKKPKSKKAPPISEETRNKMREAAIKREADKRRRRKNETNNS